MADYRFLRHSPVVALASAYAAFGLTWVALSDWAVGLVVRDPDLLTLVQSLKGWLFVCAGAVLILIVGRRLMARLEASERRYRLLFADSPLPMVIYDPETAGFIEANDAACAAFGYEPGQWPKMTVPDMVPPEDRPALAERLQRLRLTGESARTGLRVVCRDGRIMDAEVFGQSVSFKGRVLRMAVVLDVTARKRAEGALMDAMERLARQDADRDQLARALAHDLREPLRQVASFVQLIERRQGGRMDAESREYIAFATEGVHRLNRLMTDLGDFAQPALLSAEDTDCARVVSEVVMSLSTEIVAAGAEIEIGPMPRLIMDGRALGVILYELVDNALKFRALDRPCRIRIEARPGKDACEFAVEDSGIGIGEEYRLAVFSLFGRLHTRDRVPGNGTGLALARKLVEAHGGWIRAEAAGQEGAVLRFALPARTADKPAGVDM